MTHLSPNFTLDELQVTSTGLPNRAPAPIVLALRYGAKRVLQPIRDRLGPLRVTSGYRSKAVNERVGGSPTSQHVRGEAADFVAVEASQVEAWAVVRDLVLTGEAPIDQAIAYEREGHIHVSWTQRRAPRGELLVKTANDGLFAWHHYEGPLKSTPTHSAAADVAPPPHEDPMQSIAKITRPMAREIAGEAKAVLGNAITRTLEALSDGQIEREEAEATLREVVGNAVDIGQRTADKALDFDEPMEALSDAAIETIGNGIRTSIAPLIAKAVAALDDWIGPNPRRLLRRIDEALDRDLEDGIVGDDRVGKVYRLAGRLVRRFPDPAHGAGIAFSGSQLMIDGVAWGVPPKSFRAP